MSYTDSYSIETKNYEAVLVYVNECTSKTKTMSLVNSFWGLYSFGFLTNVYQNFPEKAYLEILYRVTILLPFVFFLILR